MNSFAFITHPANEQEFAEKFFSVRFLPDFLISKIMKACPAYRLFDVKGVASKHSRVSGWVISSPLLTDMISNNEARTIKKVLAACKKAKKLGTRIIGLGNEFCLIEGLTETISRELAIPVTTGNSYRISALMEGLKMAVAMKGLELDEANILISGATSNIGKICATVVASKVQKLTLINKNKKQTEKIAQQILYDSGLVVRISEDIKVAVKEADVIIAANDDFPEIDSDCFKSAAIVFDIFSSQKVLAKTARKRNDVMVIEKICTKVVGGAEFNRETGLPKNTIDSGMGEVLILSLEKHYSSFTSSQVLKVRQVEDIGKLAQKHGFKVAGFLANASAGGIKTAYQGKL